jgi:hypothetical protein
MAPNNSRPIPIVLVRAMVGWGMQTGHRKVRIIVLRNYGLAVYGVVCRERMQLDLLHSAMYVEEGAEVSQTVHQIIRASVLWVSDPVIWSYKYLQALHRAAAAVPLRNQ